MQVPIKLLHPVFEFIKPSSRLIVSGLHSAIELCLQIYECPAFLQGRYAGLFSYNDAASGEARFAKFALHYGISVHEAWASIGLAPRSPTAIALQCDLQLVTMELLSNKWQFLNDLEPTVVQDTRPSVLAALQQAQQVLLGNGGTWGFEADKCGSAAWGERLDD